MRSRHEESSWRACHIHREGLRRDAEASLARLARGGCRDAADALICAHVTSIRRLAMKLRWWGVPVDDLVQEGLLGLLHAVPRYRPELGVRLLSFAALGIRRRMLRAIALHRGQGLAGEGTVWGREFFRLRREVEAAHQQGADGVEWLVERMHVTRDTARAAMAVQAPMVSLDDETMAEERSARPGPDHEALVRERWARHTHALGQALEALPARERWIVEQRQLADPPWSYRALGGRLGISGERVKQLEVRAMTRLKARLARLGIRSIVDL